MTAARFLGFAPALGLPTDALPVSLADDAQIIGRSFPLRRRGRQALGLELTIEDETGLAPRAKAVLARGEATARGDEAALSLMRQDAIPLDLSPAARFWLPALLIESMWSTFAPDIPHGRPATRSRPTGSNCRVIPIEGPIGDAPNRAADIVPQIQAAAGSTLVLTIASGGGFIAEELEIVDALQRHPQLVVAYCLRAESAALGIALATDIRVADPAARFLCHRATAADIEPLRTAAELRRRADQIDEATARTVAWIAERAGQPASVARRWIDAGRIFNAPEALRAGIVQKIASWAP